MQQDDRIFAVVGAGVLAAVALIAALVWLGTGITVEAPQRVSVAEIERPIPERAASVAGASAAGDQSSAADADSALVRAAAARLSAHPRFAGWLVSDRLLRRFVAAVDAIAGGYSPREEIEFMRPERPFVVREEGDALVIAASSFHRYDTVAEIVESLDVAGAVALYRRFEPRLEEIYAEIGWASDTFDARFSEAVDHLLAAAVDQPGPIEVEQRSIVYAYADDRLEHLSDAQKQLLRMGPENVRRVAATLGELRRVMGWPKPEPAPAMVTAELQPLAAPDAAMGEGTSDGVTVTTVETEIDRVGAPAAH
jgi:hypothetical protein